MYLYFMTAVFLSFLEFFLSKKELMLSIPQKAIPGLEEKCATQLWDSLI